MPQTSVLWPTSPTPEASTVLGSWRHPRASQGCQEWRWRQPGQSCARDQRESGTLQKEAHMRGCVNGPWLPRMMAELGKEWGFYPGIPETTHNAHTPDALLATQHPGAFLSQAWCLCLPQKFPSGGSTSRIGAELVPQSGPCLVPSPGQGGAPQEGDGWAGAPGRGTLSAGTRSTAGHGEGWAGLGTRRLAVSLAQASPASNHKPAAAVQDSHFSSSQH